MYLEHSTPFPLTRPPRSESLRPKGLQIETLHEKGSTHLNEDALCLSDSQFGVFDGATSLTGQTYANGLSGGYLAAAIAARTFAETKASLPETGKLANTRIRTTMREQGVELEQKDNLWSTSAAVVRLNHDSLEWLQTGDSLILVLYQNGSHRLLSNPPDHDCETLSLWKRMAPECQGDIGEELACQILKVRRGMNIDYGVLNGEPEAIDHLSYGHLSLDGVSDILIYTDGLQLPRENPEEAFDITGLIRLYRSGGLKAIHRQIKRLQESDPDCMLYPRFKTHDDIGAIALSWS